MIIDLFTSISYTILISHTFSSIFSFLKASALHQLINDAIIHFSYSPIRRPLQEDSEKLYLVDKPDMDDLFREEVILFMSALLIRQQSIKYIQQSIKEAKLLFLKNNPLHPTPSHEPIEKIFLLMQSNSLFLPPKCLPKEIPALARLSEKIQDNSQKLFESFLHILNKYPNKLLLRQQLKHDFLSQKDQDFLYAQLMIFSREIKQSTEEKLNEISLHQVLIQARKLFALQRTFWNNSQELHNKFSFHDELEKAILDSMQLDGWTTLNHYIFFKYWMQWALSLYIIPQN